MNEVPWGAIVGGTVLLLVGLYLVFYEEMSTSIGDAFSTALVEQAHPDFLRWLRWVGVLVSVRGLYLISTSYLRSPGLSSTLIAFGHEALSLLSVPLVLWLRDHADVIPVVSLVDGQMRVRPLQAVGAVRSALNVLVTLILIGVAFSVARIVTGTGTRGGEG
ncbi:MAG: hypothetical protein JXA09_08150 [Anaerolineae bacterium]|nr:hypothetical protein [Anaerolineae bacterium]